MNSQDWIRAAEIAVYRVIEQNKAETQKQLEGMRAKLKRIHRACNYATISIILFLVYAGTRNY